MPVFTFPSRSVEDILEMGQDRYLIRATRSLPEKEEPAAEYEIIDEFPFWKNGKGFTRGQRSALYLYDAVSQTLSLITDETEDCQAVSVCGNQILYKAYPWTDVCGQYSGIYLKDLTNGRRLCLLPPDTRRTGLISFWEDGRALVTTCQDSPYGNSRYLDFYTMDLSNGSMEQLAPYDYACGSTVGTDARLGAASHGSRKGTFSISSPPEDRHPVCILYPGTAVWKKCPLVLVPVTLSMYFRKTSWSAAYMMRNSLNCI